MKKNSKSFIRRNSKKSESNSDSRKLNEIHTHLSNLHFQVEQEPTIKHEKFNTRTHVRNPDFRIKFGKFQCFLELDGKVHGTLEQPTQKTLSRNADFERAKLPYVIVSEEDAKFFKLDICDLSAYLIEQEYSKFLSREEFLL